MKYDLKTMTLGGYTLDQIRSMQQDVRKDAAEFVSNGLDEATTILAELMEIAGEQEVDDQEIIKDLQSKVDTATELLKAVDTVATVSGVSYYLPFHSSYGYDYDDERPWSSQVEDMATQLDNRNLYWILDSMESNSCNWNESRC